jgi:hypothetical protein
MRHCRSGYRVFPAFEDGSTQTVNRRVIFDVGGHKRGRAAKTHLIIKFFKAALGAGEAMMWAPSFARARAMAANPRPR